ncbi:MAG: hypothetical protein JW712_12790 [Dehalococcoidales bacterium]|nr:hypothetical protein [Dehalococcoidales bacterium]
MKRAGLIAGLVGFLTFVLFLLAFGGEGGTFRLTIGSIMYTITFSVMYLTILGVGFYWPIFSGLLIGVGGLMWLGLMISTMFNTYTPWMSLLTSLIGLPCVVSGVLLIISGVKRYREE